jgi:cytosine/adenosine deaminase-related metal-dependent hydrolase
MPRTLVKGWYFDAEAGPGDRFVKGWAVIDNGRFLEGSPSSVAMPGDPDMEGIVIPALPNAHTHLGDFMLREHVKPGMTVEELVAPPDGLKHRMLREINVQVSISKALDTLKATGTGHFCDFREGGSVGLDVMGSAMVAKGRNLRATILGRPARLEYSKDEVDTILSKCNGIGVSGIGDWDRDVLSKVSEHVRKEGKTFALHASEAVREEIEVVMDLHPHFVIHMTMGNKGDFHRLSVLGIPVVTCPRSNMFYGREPPIRAMLDAEVEVCLGTDNAMLSDLSMFGELEAVRGMGLSKEEAWGLIENSWKLLNRDYGMQGGASESRWIVVETVTGDPMDYLTGTGPGVVVKRP